MRTRRAITMLAVAALMALGAVWVANNWLQARMMVPEAAADAGRMPVVVAAREIPFGTQIQTLDVRVLHLPPDAVPPGTLRDPGETHGRVATQTIYAGELIMRERVAEHRAGSALAAVIAPQKRAMTVRVNDVIGVAGFLLPGNRVDVLATRQDADRRVRSRTLLENIKVLAVDQRASSDKNEPTPVRAVTLELTPEEAEDLVKATQEGTVQLSLRNPRDEARMVRAEPVAPPPPARPVAAQPKPAPAQAPPPPRDSNVTVIRGTNVSETRVGR